MTLFSGLLDLLFPPRCVSCQKVGQYFCDVCSKQIRWVQHQICAYCKKAAIGGITHPVCRKKWGLDGLISGFYYTGPLKAAIHLFKYKEVTDLRRVMKDLLLTSLKEQGMHVEGFVLVPVPLHPKKERQRGFNQSRIIAKFFENNELIEALGRVKNTQAQAKLLLSDRRRNLQDAFVLKVGVTDKQVLLVDDIFTSGATLFSAAEVLKRNGAVKVWGLTFARSQDF